MGEKLYHLLESEVRDSLKTVLLFYSLSSDFLFYLGYSLVDSDALHYFQNLLIIQNDFSGIINLLFFST